MRRREGRAGEEMRPFASDPNRVGVFHPSSEDGNRSTLRNVVFFSI
jgi:hypothetical protein